MQAFEPAPHARLHCAKRLALARGDLSLGETPVVRELDRLSLDVRQTVEGGAHHLTEQGNFFPATRVRVADIAGFREEMILADPGSMLPAAQKIDGAVPGDTNQPGSDRASRGVVVYGVPPALEEGVLEHLLRERAIPHDSEGQGEEDPRVSVVEVSERPLVMADHPREEGAVM